MSKSCQTKENEERLRLEGLSNLPSHTMPNTPCTMCLYCFHVLEISDRLMLYDSEPSIPTRCCCGHSCRDPLPSGPMKNTFSIPTFVYGVSGRKTGSRHDAHVCGDPERQAPARPSHLPSCAAAAAAASATATASAATTASAAAVVLASCQLRTPID